MADPLAIDDIQINEPISMHAMNKLLDNKPSVATANPAGGPRSSSKILVRNLNFFYGRYQALHDINLEVPERRVTAFIGQIGRASCRERV